MRGLLQFVCREEAIREFIPEKGIQTILSGFLLNLKKCVTKI